MNKDLRLLLRTARLALAMLLSLAFVACGPGAENTGSTSTTPTTPTTGSSGGGSTTTPGTGTSGSAQTPGSTASPTAECTSDGDCAPVGCCHPATCAPTRAPRPSCADVMCTMNCQPDTLDCGGTCRCIAGRCAAHDNAGHPLTSAGR